MKGFFFNSLQYNFIIPWYMEREQVNINIHYLLRRQQCILVFIGHKSMTLFWHGDKWWGGAGDNNNNNICDTCTNCVTNFTRGQWGAEKETLKWATASTQAPLTHLFPRSLNASHFWISGGTFHPKRFTIELRFLFMLNRWSCRENQNVLLF